MFTKDEAETFIDDFLKDFPLAQTLNRAVFETQTDAYGANAHPDKVGVFLGAFLPATHGIEIIANNIRDADEFRGVLRHEVLGHMGLNTFEPTQKKAILNALVDAQDAPVIRNVWRDVRAMYSAELGDLRLAEEVFALSCEKITEVQRVDSKEITELLGRIESADRKLDADGLQKLVQYVEHGMREDTLGIRVFPATDHDLFRKKDMDAKKPFHQVVAEKLIEQLRSGTAPWQRPWEPGEGGLPMNPTTGKRYKGINTIHLLSQGYSDPRWMTYNQAAGEGAQVRKGEKGTAVQYWKFSEEQDKIGTDGRPVLDDAGKPVKETVLLERPRVFFATVFNAEQIDGLPPLQVNPNRWDGVERAEHILTASGAAITHAPGDRAFYRPSTDSITLPERSQFHSAEGYYTVALHELGHWTGHPSRLNRDLAHPFGSEGYAREELRAEIASMIINAELGTRSDPGQHAAYVGSWIKVLQNDPMEIFRAAADAEKIHDYVLAFEQKQIQEHDWVQTAAEVASARVEAQAVACLPLPPLLHALDAETRALEHEHIKVVGAAVAEFRAGRLTAEQVSEVAETTRLAVRDGLDQIPSPVMVDDTGRLDVPIGSVNVRGYVETAHGEERADLQNAEYYRVVQLGKPISEAFSELQDAQLAAERLRAVGEQAKVFALMAPIPTPSEQTDQRLRSSVPAEVTQTLENLDATVQRYGYTTNLTRQDGVEHPLLVLNYLGSDGQQLPLHTEIGMDGKASTFLYGERDGYHKMTNDPQWQRDALDEQISHMLVQQATARSVAQDGVTRELQDAGHSDRVQLMAAALAELKEGRLTDTGFNAISQTLMNAEFSEPSHWTGELRVRGCREIIEPKGVSIVSAPDGEAEFYTVYTVLDDGRAMAFSDHQSKGTAESRQTELTAIVSGAQQYLAASRKEAQEQGEAMNTTTVSDDKVWLDVPYKQKDEVKALGARWDRAERSWYVPAGLDVTPFEQWRAAPKVDQEAPVLPTPARQYLAVPYGERQVAKAAGAEWDKAAKSWYAGPKADMDVLKRWLPDNVNQQAPAMSPREEFADLLRTMGCVVDGQHPIMNGETQRIAVTGDDRGEKAGFYVAYLDGHPAGYVRNNRSGEEAKWKSKGYSLTDEEKARLTAEAATKLEQRRLDELATQEATATRLAAQVAQLLPADGTPYQRAKGISSFDGVLMDDAGKTTYIPAFDADGKLWTVQYIQEDGTKRFARDSRKEGCFHPVGGFAALDEAPAVVISEGYATAATAAEALQFATVAAFDSGNLKAVAQALHERYPDKPILIAGDNDLALTYQLGVNPGRDKAEEAARAVGGQWCVPVFTTEEIGWPAGVPKVTPKLYRDHCTAKKALEDDGALSPSQAEELGKKLLSEEQLQALATLKLRSDFNDLDRRSTIHHDRAVQQLGSAVLKAVQDHRAARTSPEQERQVVNEQEQEQAKRRSVRMG